MRLHVEAARVVFQRLEAVSKLAELDSPQIMLVRELVMLALTEAHREGFELGIECADAQADGFLDGGETEKEPATVVLLARPAA